MFRSVIRATLILGLAGGVAACSGQAPQAAHLAATQQQFAVAPDFAQSVQVAVGDDVVITLDANTSAGFTWEQPQLGDTTIISLVSSAFQAPSVEVAGAAGTQVYSIHALASGRTTFWTRYSQPWVGGQKAVRTYSLTLFVR